MKKKFYLPVAIVAAATAVLFFSHSLSTRARDLRPPPVLSDFDEEAPFPGNDFFPADAASRRQFESWLASDRDPAVVPAIIAGIVHGNRLVYHAGSNANLDTGFCIASLTKTFTAVLALRLQEEGVFSLDDPVKKHLPGVVLERSEIGSSPVTLRHLLAHTSGMPSFGERTAVFCINGEKIQLPVQVNPAGYWYAYSNDSYVLMKYVIEAATGRSYSENMQLKVFRPLGMLRSSAESSNGTGGIVTTMNDLVKYVSFLVRMGEGKRGRILSANSYRQMLASSVETPGLRNDYYYSLGWEVIRVHGRTESYYKAGRWFGGASGIQVFPEKRIAIVYLCDPPDHLSEPFMQWRQSLTGRLRSLARQYANDPALCTVWPRLSQEDLKPYEGTYRSRMNGHTIHVALANGGLYSDHPGRMVPLRPFTSIRFIPESGSTLHHFVWRDRQVAGLALRSGFYDRIR